MRPSSSLSAAIAIAITTAALLGCAGAEVADGKGAATRQNSRAVDRGARQFRASCAGCHGADARGNGPIAPILNVAVPDLTSITARHGGKFLEVDVYRIIDGQADLSAHGPRHMPVWGYEFFGDDPDDEAAHAQATEKIERVISYLRSIQR